MTFFLLAFPALVSIINPLGVAFVFLGATRQFSPEMRTRLARWVAIYSFIILNASLYVGAYVLQFFGISIPVLRVAGGIIVAMSGWRLLYAEDDAPQESTITLAHTQDDASRVAFFPLTMPFTTGPGTIAVAIALGSSRPSEPERFLTFVAAELLTTSLLSLLIYLCYRYSDRISRAVGSTGTTIIVRLSAFLLFCIGVQVLWTGAAELLATLQKP